MEARVFPLTCAPLLPSPCSHAKANADARISYFKTKTLHGVVLRRCANKEEVLLEGMPPEYYDDDWQSRQQEKTKELHRRRREEEEEEERKIEEYREIGMRLKGYPEEDVRNARKLVSSFIRAEEEVEEKIEEAAERGELTELVLMVIWNRLDLARRDEEKDAIRSLDLLYRRVEAEILKREATPAMRLLNDLLNMHDGFDDEGWLKECKKLMVDTFPREAPFTILAPAGFDMEKMKEEMMLLGFISLLLTATSSTISNICISSKFYNSTFAPCTRSEIDEEVESNSSEGRKLMGFLFPHPFRRVLNELNKNTCKEGYEPFVSYEGLEQLHRFIFVMAVTHVSYSCLTMLLAIVKIHSWRVWEDEAHMDRHDSLAEITRDLTIRRQTNFVRYHTSNPLVRNNLIIWVTCFFRQFGRSVVRADYLTLRKGFIMNHNLSPKYDFHSYMIRSMEEEFQRIVGVSGPLWGFVVAFMLFNVKGSNLYFWIAIIPVTLVLLVGSKLQHVIATLALENAGITGYFAGAKLKPRDELFWFNKPELMLSLIHFILFQNAFELASFFWFWWQFGYNSCFIHNHLLVYLRLILGFAGQFLCSYSTLPLYALVTQMGTNYKAALIPQRIRETIHGWGKEARRKRRHGRFADDSTIHTDTSTVVSLEEYDHQLIDNPETAAAGGTANSTDAEVELQPRKASNTPSSVPNETSSRVGTPLLRPSASVSVSVSVTTTSLNYHTEGIPRSSSMPT